jgi:hypothetical protein
MTPGSERHPIEGVTGWNGASACSGQASAYPETTRLDT